MSQTPPQESRPAGLRDRWWWSSTLWLVVGGGIVAYQWPALSGEIDGFWANWAMAALGLAIAVVGAVRLHRDWRAEQVRRAGPTDQG